MDTIDEMTSEPLDDGKWYVIHTYSGYENKVADKIQMLIEKKKDPDVFGVMVPMEKHTEIKNNARVVKERKVLPGYVLVKMNITPSSWYLIRNTNGVTGFVGPGSKPVPLSKREVAQFGVREKVSEDAPLDVNPGDTIEIIYGPFAGFAADVEEVDQDKRTVKGMITMFGRETQVEISFDDIEVQK
jgi:transcriptional antiterminator NusG